MARNVITQAEIIEWHKEFQRIIYDWADWLRTNTVHHKSAEDAWIAYKTQRQGDFIAIPGIEAWLQNKQERNDEKVYRDSKT